jgi:hypothetical protein
LILATLAAHQLSAPIDGFFAAISALVLGPIALKTYDYVQQPFPHRPLSNRADHIAALNASLDGLEEQRLLALHLMNPHNTTLARLTAEQRRHTKQQFAMINRELQALGLAYDANAAAWRSLVMSLPCLSIAQMVLVSHGLHPLLIVPAIPLLLLLHQLSHACIATLAGRVAVRDKRFELERLRIAPTREEYSLALALFGWEALRATAVDQFAKTQIALRSSSGGDVGFSSSSSDGGCGGGGCGGD